MDQMNLTKDWYTVAEVAEMFGVSGDTVRRWNRRGLIEATRTLENHRRFTREEVERAKARADERQHNA